MTVRIDDEDVTQLARALGDAGAEISKDVEKVVARGALNIKRDASKRVTGLKHAPAYPRSISYETRRTPLQFSAEIGPDKDRRQGALGNILEYGTVKNPPRPHMRPAADAELPRFERALQDAAVKLTGVDR